MNFRSIAQSSAGICFFLAFAAVIVKFLPGFSVPASIDPQTFAMLAIAAAIVGATK